MLPSDFAPWQTVYYYFRKWKLEGVWEELLNVLHAKARKSVGREESPSLGIIDSRSFKTSHHVDTDRGIDGNKKIKGREEKNISLLILWDCQWPSRYMKPISMTAKGQNQP